MITETEYKEKVSEKVDALSATQVSLPGILISESELPSEPVSPMESGLLSEALIEQVIYHEFKSPLSTIKGYLQLIKKGTFDPEEQERIVNLMMERIDSLNQLVSDLTSLTISDKSRLDAGRDSISGLLGIVHEEFSRFGNDGGHTINLELPEEEICCDFDRNMMNKVYTNLIGNAIKFTPDGGRITIGLRVMGEEVVTYVEDNGIGIDPSCKEWIWQPFKSTDNSLLHHLSQGYDFQGDGVGIGLALVKHIVEMHGGRVEVESQGVGKGSKFTVVLKKEIDPDF